MKCWLLVLLCLSVQAWGEEAGDGMNRFQVEQWRQRLESAVQKAKARANSN